MSKTAVRLVMTFIFAALSPLSWSIGELFFTHPFDSNLYDPIVIVCPDHVGILMFHELSARNNLPTEEECTFQVDPTRQAWVERSVGQLQSQNPRQSGWKIDVKQLGKNHQRIDLELIGDGVSGLIYEVQSERIMPLKSRLTGPIGVFFPVALNVILWFAISLAVWVAQRMRGRPVAGECSDS